MTCEKFAEMLDNYESLTDEEKALMEEHAAACEECRRELDFMCSMINAVKTLPEIKVPDDFLENLNKRIDAEAVLVRRRGFAGYISYNWKKYSAVAACLVLAVVIGANYNTLVDNMNGDDDGVIDTVTTVASPMPDNDEPVAETVIPDKNLSADKAPERKEADVAQPNRRSDIINSGMSVFRNASGSITRQSSSDDAPPQATEQTYIADTAMAEKITETSKPTDGGVETMTLPRSVYIESRGAGTVEESENDESVIDNPYEVRAMSETGSYAVAAIEEDKIEGRSARLMIEDDGPDYELNQSNLIIVKGEDFATAYAIIRRYVSDSYNNYFMVKAENIGAMLSALEDAGVYYNDNISVDADEITFRIVIG